MDKKLKSVIGVVIVLLVGVWIFDMVFEKKPITSFEECAAAGYPIMESFPEQCNTPDGKHFVAEPKLGGTVVPEENNSDVVLDSIQMNQTIGSPLTITGKALGGYYFEASFPVRLLDSSGKVIASAPAQAQSDWMTSDYVPFKATLSFTAPKSGDGTLVFHNDNPSGLPENDKEVRIPIKFAPQVYRNAEFDSNLNLKIGDSVSFSDTLVVTLKTINDSRCPKDVQCIWAGELNPVLVVGKAQSEVILGTITKQAVTFGNYTFTLKGATETTATISIHKNN